MEKPVLPCVGGLDPDVSGLIRPVVVDGSDRDVEHLGYLGALRDSEAAQGVYAQLGVEGL